MSLIQIFSANPMWEGAHYAANNAVAPPIETTWTIPLAAEFLVVWHDIQRTGNRDTSGCFLDPDGVNEQAALIAEFDNSIGQSFFLYHFLQSQFTPGISTTFRAGVTTSARQSLIIAAYSGVDQGNPVAEFNTGFLNQVNTTWGLDFNAPTGTTVADFVQTGRSDQEVVNPDAGQTLRSGPHYESTSNVTMYHSDKPGDGNPTNLGWSGTENATYRKMGGIVINPGGAPPGPTFQPAWAAQATKVIQRVNQ